MPIDDGGAIVYPFGRWSRGYVLADSDGFAQTMQTRIRRGLGRYAWCLFFVLFAGTVLASAHSRIWGGPFISVQMRPAASTAIVTLPVCLYFMGRRLLVYRHVRRLAPGTYLGRLFVWANVDNAFGAAVRHPQGAYVVAPWLDAGRKYRLDALSESTAKRVVWGCIAAELCTIGFVCSILIGVYHQPASCIYGVSVYFSVLQPVLSGIQMHVLLPVLAQRYDPRTFDDAMLIDTRYRWLRVFVISSVYMAMLLLTRGPQSLHVKEHQPMQTYLYLAAYATATCYATLSFACLVKTWARAWSVDSALKSVIARCIFLLAFLFLAASIFEPIKSDYASAIKALTGPKQ